MNRINDKTKQLQKYLEELKSIIPGSYKEYNNSIKNRAACERYFEIIIETLIDLAFLIIKKERFQMPEDNKVFNTLFENGIIDNELMEKLQDAKGMRNILSHNYGNIDDEIVYEAIKEEIIKDCKEFLKQIQKYDKN